MKSFLFDPFRKIAGAKALLAGITGIILTGIICFYGNVRLDGILDIHYSANNETFLIIADGIINLVIISIVFSILGIMIAGLRFRFIDLLGTMALARVPLIIPTFTALILPQNKMTDYFSYTYLKTGPEVSITIWNWVSFIFFALLMILTVIWTVALMWKAFKICMNRKDTKTALTFVAGLIAAEIISKLTFYFFVK